MTTNDLPEIAELTAEQLIELRNRIDQRLETVRADFIDQATALGLVVTNGKKRGRRKNKDAD